MHKRDFSKENPQAFLASSKKRGQITIFIIVGILILVGIATLYIVNNNSAQNKNNTVPTEMQPLQDYIENCVEETLKQGILDIAKTGGTYKGSRQDAALDIPYYVYEGQNIMPTKEQVGDALTEYVTDNIGTCLNGYEQFPEYRVIPNGEPTSEVIITEESIEFNYNYPQVIESNDQTYELEYFTTTMPTRFGILYDAAAYLTEDQVEHLNTECVSCILSISLTENLTVVNTNLNKETSIYVLTDEINQINNEPVTFLFAFHRQ